MNTYDNKHLAFPFRIGSNGKTAQVSSLEDHIRDEIIQLLLTTPEERVFLPDFGAGVKQLVFSTTDDFTIAKAKSLVTHAISNWLGKRVNLQNVDLAVENEKINIKISYSIAGSEEIESISVQR